MTDDAGRDLARIQKWNLLALALAIGWAAWSYDRFVAWSVAVGGALGATNFWLTSQVVRRTFVAKDTGVSGGLVVLKFVVFFGAVGAVLWLLKPDSTGFGVGFCTVLVAIVLKAIVDLAGQKDDFEEQEPKGPDGDDRGA